MLTSKERAEMRAQANNLETTLIVGKDGVTDALIAEADNQLGDVQENKHPPLYAFHDFIAIVKLGDLNGARPVHLVIASEETVGFIGRNLFSHGNDLLHLMSYSTTDRDHCQ